MTAKLFRIAGVTIITLASALFVSLAPAPAASEGEATFTDSLAGMLHGRVAAIFRQNCATSACHSGAYPKARLSLEPEKMLAALKNVPSRQIAALKLVDTAHPEKGYLSMKIRGDNGIKGARMPIEAPPLESEEITTIEFWVASLAVLEKAAAPAAPSDQGKKKP